MSSTNQNPNSENNQSAYAISDALHRAKDRRRQILLAGGIGIVAVISLVGGSFLVGDKKSPAVAAFNVSSTQSVVPDESPVTSAVAGSASPITANAKISTETRPKELIVTRNDGDVGSLIVVDGRTAKTIRTLDSGKHLFDGVALSRDGKTAYYGIHDTDCDSPSLHRVSVAGGTPEKLADYGSSPSESPDGTKLAYQSGAGCDVGQRITVRDLKTGSEVVIASNDADGDVAESSGFTTATNGLDWSDSTHVLAYVPVYEDQDAKTQTVGKSGFKTFSISNSDVNIRTAPVASGYSGLSQNVIYSWPSLTSNGKLLTVESSVQGQIDTASRMVLIDPKSQAVERVVATGLAGREYRDISSDATGTHILYVSNTDLRVSDNASTPTVLLTNITGAAWH